MPINYTITETKESQERRAGKTAKQLYHEYRGHLPIDVFTDAGYEASELEGMFEVEEVLESSLRPQTARLLLKMLDGGCLAQVPMQTLTELLLAENVIRLALPGADGPVCPNGTGCPAAPSASPRGLAAPRTLRGE